MPSTNITSLIPCLRNSPLRLCASPVLCDLLESSMLPGECVHHPDRPASLPVPSAAKAPCAVVCPALELLESSGAICPRAAAVRQAGLRHPLEISETGASSDGFRQCAVSTHLGSTDGHSLACLPFDPRASDDTQWQATKVPEPKYKSCDSVGICSIQALS